MAETVEVEAEAEHVATVPPVPPVMLPSDENLAMLPQMDDAERMDITLCSSSSGWLHTEEIHTRTFWIQA